MYAETFDVQAKYETQSKWVRWAMQGLTFSRPLSEVRYNLQEFWKALESVKGAAGSPRDWGDLLTLDAQSQWTLAKLFEADMLALQRQANDYATAKGLSNLLDPFASAKKLAERLLGLSDPVLSAMGEKMAALGRQAEAAARASQSLATQAQAAYRQAKVTVHQAGNTNTVATGAIGAAQSSARNGKTFLDRTVKADQALFPSLPSFSLPWWVWAAGAAAVALLLTASQAPRLVAVGAARKAMA
jgi:hypothetical protein